MALPEGTVVPPPADGWRRVVEPDTRLMFRYSAVTFNTHRIHYDLPYAREVEGYPALVFQGPLSALLIAATASADAGRPLQSFTFKATNPLFAGLPFTITGRLDGDAGTAEITRNDGAVAMEALYTMSEARTYLYVPGHRPDRFAKAFASGADAVILDLEDAVPIGAKDDAACRRRRNARRRRPRVGADQRR